jgi:NAD(P)-dependent dehydrogenase (short-subunit alcohol dehydrogenase family)
MPTSLITGANRGLGFEHARQFAERGWQVLACARQPESTGPLQDLARRFPARVQIHPLEMNDFDAIDRLARVLQGQPVDVLINNAGTYGPLGVPEGMAYQTLSGMDYGLWREILEVNLLAPFRMSVAFYPHLLAGQKRLLVMMSSDLGSVAQNQQGGSYAYRASKAALNMVARGMSREWRELIVIAMAPGWCHTHLGGPAAPVDPAESVRLQQQVFDGLTLADSGQFINRFGETVPW